MWTREALEKPFPLVGWADPGRPGPELGPKYQRQRVYTGQHLQKRAAMKAGTLSGGPARWPNAKEGAQPAGQCQARGARKGFAAWPREGPGVRWWGVKEARPGPFARGDLAAQRGHPVLGHFKLGSDRDHVQGGGRWRRKMVNCGPS